MHPRNIAVKISTVEKGCHLFSESLGFYGAHGS
jgi:hypothetical protein